MSLQWKGAYVLAMNAFESENWSCVYVGYGLKFK
jgi:Radial spokehead-like protein